MADFHTRFVHETFDPQGQVTEFHYLYREDFNYGYDVLDRLAQEEPHRLAIIWRNDRGERLTLSFSQLAKLSNQAANLFQKRGLKKGDAILTALRSHWTYWVVALAAHKMGLLLVPVYYRLTEEEIAYRLTASKAGAVVCCPGGDTPERVRKAADRVGVPLRFVAEGAQEGFEDLTRLLPGEPAEWDRVETNCRDSLLLYFTSGTTGTPKGVLHNHLCPLSHYWGARYMQDVHRGSIHFATGDTGWEVVCGTKFYGQWMCLGTILVYDYDRFPPEKVLRCLVQEKATSIMAQPTVYRQLTDVGMDRYDLSAVTNYAVGGEKLPPDLAQIVLQQTGHRLYEGYAQSETGLIAALSKRLGRKEGSVGKILPKYHVALRKEDGTFAQPGEEGEIVILADGGEAPLGVMMGYLGDEEATGNLWDGPVFHTGDIAILDEEGYLFYRGRSDGILKTKGYRVSPVELEERLVQHEAVRECLVVGQPDRDLGQKITAYVVLEPGRTPTEALKQDLLDYHNSRCAGFKKIRELHFVEALKRNPNGKVIRGQFR